MATPVQLTLPPGLGSRSALRRDRSRCWYRTLDRRRWDGRYTRRIWEPKRGARYFAGRADGIDCAAPDVPRRCGREPSAHCCREELWTWSDLRRLEGRAGRLDFIRFAVVGANLVSLQRFFVLAECRIASRTFSSDEFQDTDQLQAEFCSCSRPRSAELTGAPSSPVRQVSLMLCPRTILSFPAPDVSLSTRTQTNVLQHGEALVNLTVSFSRHAAIQQAVMNASFAPLLLRNSLPIVVWRR